MSRARNRRLPLARGLALMGLAGAWAAACGGPQSLGAAGAVCFRSDDCQPGLACVPETMAAAKHVCSADLSGIVSMVDGAAPDTGATPDPNGGAAGSVDPGTGGEPATAGGVGGNTATAGAVNTAGSGTAGMPAGGSASAGAPAGGTSPGGSANAGGPAGGAPAAGSGGAVVPGGGAGSGGASAGTAG